VGKFNEVQKKKVQNVKQKGRKTKSKGKIKSERVKMLRKGGEEGEGREKNHFQTEGKGYFFFRER
jgi:hypothetical protein